MAVRSFVNSVMSSGITDATTPINVKQLRVTNFMALLVTCMLLPWIPVAAIAHETPALVANIVAAVVLLSVILLNRQGRYFAATSVLMVTAHLQLLWTNWLTGYPSGTWFYYAPLVFVPFVAFRREHRSLALAFSVLAGLCFLGIFIFRQHFPARITLINEQASSIVNSVAAIGFFLALAIVFMGAVDDTEDALDHQRAQADALLLNVLPASIATRLKNSPNTVIADRCGEVTVLFADIVGFTALSSRAKPAETVKMLNEIFTMFDELCERNGVERIKTIGDGYMAFSGASAQSIDHAATMTRVAIGMRDYMESHPFDEPLQVRIGLNSGEVIAGIVGTTRFHYDIWGDAVNVASRMESTGEPGRIHIARSTWEKVHEIYPCEPRGRIPVKGKGQLETWFVL